MKVETAGVATDMLKDAPDAGETTTPATESGKTEAPAEKPVASNDHWTVGLSLEQDDIDYLAAKGLKDLDQGEAFKRNLDSYRKLEKKMGVPEDRLLKIPEEGEDMSDVWDRLGRPVDAEGYSTPDGDNEADSVLSWAKGAMYEAGISKDAGDKLLTGYNEQIKSMVDNINNELQMGQEQQINELKKEWGSNFDVRIQAAREFASSMGFDEDVLNTIENAAGSRKMLEVMYSNSQRIGQDTTVNSKSTGTTVEEARGQIKSLIDEISVDPKRLRIYNTGKGSDFEKMKRLQKLQYQ